MLAKQPSLVWLTGDASYISNGSYRGEAGCRSLKLRREVGLGNEH